MLANELADALRGREVIRASIDGFHRPRDERNRLGSDSPEGYYRDSFDLDALRRELLEPLGPSGSRLYRAAVFDFRTDAPVEAPGRRARDDAVLVFDGVVLLRAEIRDDWDLSIFVRVAPEESLGRALRRDLKLFGSTEEIERRYRTRYLPGQQLYLADADPTARADFVLDNDCPEQPRLSQPCPRDSPC